MATHRGKAGARMESIECLCVSVICVQCCNNIPLYMYMIDNIVELLPISSFRCICFNKTTKHDVIWYRWSFCRSVTD